MPFDGATTKPSLQNLADVLRDKSRWPHHFQWNYDCAESCAVGLARRLWTGYNDYHPSVSSSMGHWFGTPTAVARAIFIKLHEKHGCSTYFITPEHVADAIDQYLKNSA